MGKIGLSLSFCVRDIANGKVDESDVDKIIAGIKAESYEQFVDIVQSYSDTHWSGSIDAESIAYRLWNAGKIDQPRLRGESAPNISNRQYWR